ncbi:MAG: hypothetical protein ABIQ86_12595 [Steroidobacteraceae bacterium]
MYADLRQGILKTALFTMAGITALSMPALAQHGPMRLTEAPTQRWWLSAGLGGAAVHSAASAPSAGRNGIAASIDLGYRFSPQWGMGFEYGVVAPLSGCTVWECAGSTGEFSPNFTRMLAFGEYRPRRSGWRFRAGAGVSGFCYSHHWSDSAWGWGDTLEVLFSAIVDEEYKDDGRRDGAWRCDGRTKALGGAVSMGYDWPAKNRAPVSMGVRLSVEAARFEGTPAIGLPAFRHRALMLTLHLNAN